jgi:hypothetical protein
MPNTIDRTDAPTYVVRQLIDELGGPSSVAQWMGVSNQAVTKWRLGQRRMSQDNYEILCYLHEQYAETESACMLS